MIHEDSGMCDDIQFQWWVCFGPEVGCEELRLFGMRIVGHKVLNGQKCCRKVKNRVSLFGQERPLAGSQTL